MLQIITAVMPMLLAIILMGRFAAYVTQDIVAMASPALVIKQCKKLLI